MRLLNALASSNNEGAVSLGGGTNVLIDLRARNVAPTNLTSFKNYHEQSESEGVNKEPETLETVFSLLAKHGN